MPSEFRPGTSRRAFWSSGGASTRGVGSMGSKPRAAIPNAEAVGSSLAEPDRVPSSRAATAVAAPTLAALTPASFLLFTCCPFIRSVPIDEHERPQGNLDQLVERVRRHPDAAIAGSGTEYIGRGPGMDRDGSRAAAEAVESRAVGAQRQDHWRVPLRGVTERTEQKRAPRWSRMGIRAGAHRPATQALAPLEQLHIEGTKVNPDEIRGYRPIECSIGYPAGGTVGTRGQQHLYPSGLLGDRRQPGVADLLGIKSGDRSAAGRGVDHDLAPWMHHAAVGGHHRAGIQRRPLDRGVCGALRQLGEICWNDGRWDRG